MSLIWFIACLMTVLYIYGIVCAVRKAKEIKSKNMSHRQLQRLYRLLRKFNNE